MTLCTITQQFQELLFAGLRFHGSVLLLKCFRCVPTARIVSAHATFQVIYHPVSEHTLLTSIELV